KGPGSISPGLFAFHPGLDAAFDVTKAASRHQLLRAQACEQPATRVNGR
ncbi:MAG: hypothetical protein ACI8Q6_004081, partial [Granulosicoccus sp.]